MNLEFIGDGPALVVTGEERYLVVADLHFGIEADLALHGLHFRSRSKDRLERLLAIVDRADPDGLVLLGDVKHSIPSVTRQEYYELPLILDTLRSRVPLLVFPGNHDIGIERYLRPDEIQAKEGAIIDGVGYLHGHMYPSTSLAGHLMIIGHHHPLLSLHDDVGCALQSPAYLRAGVNTKPLGMADFEDTGAPTRVLFMPSFNEIAGYDILRIIRNPTSPLSRNIIQEDTEIILADGTYIGPPQSLIPDESD
ncbi:MAG: metallophosphoesterase [Methanoregulaceae archaeon]|nr:metallophosphoesterase [Methanoregulaceae archaeon]